jgi:hypothetical protein
MVMICVSLYLLFRMQASWRHTRPETSTFQWPDFWGGLQVDGTFSSTSEPPPVIVTVSVAPPIATGTLIFIGTDVRTFKVCLAEEKPLADILST